MDEALGLLLQLGKVSETAPSGFHGLLTRPFPVLGDHDGQLS